ncbi:MAG: acyltransferase [Methylococcaceae bacterium]
MRYRKDINGLRSLAVLPVLFFHAGWEVFSGGFLGVDVFFTISGYLIASLIFQGLDEGSFSILGFYDKRARRIIPALLAVIILSTVTSMFFMLPYDLKNYGQSVVATVLSANNILLYITSGYWSLAAEFKPLYHTWSLGVEEQYYLIIPMLITILFRVSTNKAKAYFFCLSFLLIGSFFISYFSDDKEWNFLIIFSRMWELILGSLVALYLRYRDVRSNSIVSFFGLFLIVFSYVYPNMFFTNQALVNLVPVIGVCLIILFSSNESLAGRFLSFTPLFFIGTISYSVYLFHMPLLAMLRLATNGNPSVIAQLFFVILSIPLAYLTWRYIEIPFKDKNIFSNRRFYSSISITSCLLLAFGVILHKSYGLQDLFPEYSYGNNPQAYADKPYRLQRETFPLDANKENLLVIGNSFARDFINMMDEFGSLDNYDAVYITDVNNVELFTSLLDQADVVVSVSSAGMASRLNPDEVKVESNKMYNFLSKNFNGEFYRVGTKNFGWNNNFVRRMNYEDYINFRVRPNDTSISANLIEKEIWGENYVDIISLLSNESGAVRLFTPQGKFISFDTEHITRSGAEYLGSIVFENTSLKNLIK